VASGTAGFHHPLVRAAKALHHKKHRRDERCFLVEGPNLVAAALDARARLRTIFFNPRDAAPPIAELAARAKEVGADEMAVDERTLSVLSTTRSPQGIVAVAEFVDQPIEALTALVHGMPRALALVVHDVSDPGNVGTLIRSADAFGACAVCFGPDAVEPYNDKLLRASAGAFFRVPICTYDTWPQMAAAAHAAGMQLFGAEAGAADVRSVTAPERVALVVGHERHGLTGVSQADLDVRIGIPQSLHSDSLNAGVAGSLALYELSRQVGTLKT
jgi:RNA methyltransferase, TrmH family